MTEETLGSRDYSGSTEVSFVTSDDTLESGSVQLEKGYYEHLFKSSLRNHELHSENKHLKEEMRRLENKLKIMGDLLGVL